ncbi:uncharacterized protein MELLADRAFT_89852 [Melampsora larici-populina 98AG31]|uniref:Uncharacterized protein n=1 Tax=Melampsora larici-populina (strain 98AG31 / pathotype 3-4-7) TaxID=747676 RepID=F4RUV0_MELLP|nr:uncharacterized protein MELLADRAFT_89852 [Melampsora larici-populina 98AG31]EGG03759.1 hypothetical protein MELLADRAFT_89852 [Melampsora larici-populina 98AG31]
MILQSQGSEQSQSKKKVVDDEACGSVQDVVNSETPLETPRGNLLKLLDQHIIKKKARALKKPGKKKTVKQSHRPIRKRPPISPSEIDHTYAPRPQDVDYDQYTDQQLRELVGDVGLDADGLPRAELIKTCKTYQDLRHHGTLLWTSGKRSVPIAVPADSTSDPKSLPLPSSPPDTQPSNMNDDVQTQDSTLDRDNIPPITRGDSDVGNRDHKILQIEGWATIGSPVHKAPEEIPLPSLEHGRLSYPRPPPTVLTSHQNSATSKGKGKSREEDDPDDHDWDPSFHAEESDLEGSDLLAGEADSDTNDSAQPTYQGSSKGRFQMQQGTGKSNSSRKSAKKHPRKAASPKSMSESEKQNQGDDQSRESMLEMIHELRDALNKTNQRLEKLTEEVRILNQVTQNNIDEEQVSAKKKKTRGGRISLSVRFHIDTLLGLEESSPSLPAPATLNEKESWMSDLEIGLVNFDLDVLDETMEPPDLNSTDYSGPRHKDSTPQQISIMQQMMLAVGVSSFRPDFGQAPTSKDNKWLWDLAFKIFIKLVECGDGIKFTFGSPHCD